MSFRHFSLLDQCIAEIDHFMQSSVKPVHCPQRRSPAENAEDALLSEAETKEVIGLMRVNHTGEICAQALYRGQAFVANSKDTKAYLYHAANEEYDHLSWCKTRLNDLDGKTSLFNPLWYISAFKIGAAAALVSDKVSYGFVMETENQVMVHLAKHLQRLPEKDQKSRAILEQMYQDEAKHAEEAKAAGGTRLPLWARLLMKAQSKVMTTVAYLI